MSEQAKGITVTIKGDGSYSAPWVVFYGESAAEVADKIAAAEAQGLFAIVGRVAKSAEAQYAAGAGLGATPVAPIQDEAQAGWPYNPPQQGYQTPQNPTHTQPQGGYPQQGGFAPQGGSQAPQRGQHPTPPGMAAPTCPHGTKNYINGQYGPFWGCPAQRNDPSRCKAEKIR